MLFDIIIWGCILYIICFISYLFVNIVLSSDLHPAEICFLATITIMLIALALRNFPI